jgi:hypothetical protein
MNNLYFNADVEGSFGYFLRKPDDLWFVRYGDELPFTDKETTEYIHFSSKFRVSEQGHHHYDAIRVYV